MWSVTLIAEDTEINIINTAGNKKTFSFIYQESVIHKNVNQLKLRYISGGSIMR